MTSQTEHSARRTAVLLDPHPLWLDAVTEVLSHVDVEVAAATSTISDALAAVEEHRPNLFVAALLVTDSPADGIACVRQAAGLVPGLKTIVLTMEDRRNRLSMQVIEEVRKHFPKLVARTRIPRTVRLAEAPSHGKPISVYDPSSRAAKAYADLAREVEQRLRAREPIALAGSA